MSIAQISPTSVLANPTHVNPLSQATQNAAIAQVTQTAQKTVARSKTDTVTLSSKALKMNSGASELPYESQEQPFGKPVEQRKNKN